MNSYKVATLRANFSSVLLAQSVKVNKQLLSYTSKLAWKAVVFDILSFDMNDRFHEDVSDFIFFCLLECLFFLHHFSGFGLVGTNLLLFEGTKLLSPLLKGEKERCLVTNVIKLDSINNLFDLLPWANKPTPHLAHKTKHVFSCNVSMERTFPQGSKSHEVLPSVYVHSTHPPACYASPEWQTGLSACIRTKSVYY